MSNILSDLDLDEVSYVTKAANKKKFYIYKADETEISKSSKGDAKMEDTEPDKGSKEEPVEAQITKADLEALRKDYEDKLKEANEKIKKGEEDIQKERDIRETATWIQKATEELPSLPGGATPTIFGPILKEANSTMKKESFEVLYKALVAASTAMEKSDVFTEFGKGSDSTPATPESQLSALAKARSLEIRKSDSSIPMHVAEAMAYTQVVEENPEIYKQHRIDSLRVV